MAGRIDGTRLQRCSGQSSRSRPDARIGFQRIPEHYACPGNASAHRFWEPAGRPAFVTVATLLAETPDERLTVWNVLRVFTRCEGIEWLARKVTESRGTAVPYPRIVADAISDYINGDVRQVDGIRKTVTTRLQVWHNPRIAAATATGDFDVRELRRRPMTTHMAVAPGDIPRMAPLLRLFFDQLINLNTLKMPQQDPGLSVQTLVLLDEIRAPRSRRQPLACRAVCSRQWAEVALCRAEQSAAAGAVRPAGRG
jgi:hypothetical protein